MLLVIDVGNTNTKFAILNGTKLCALWKSQTNRWRTSNEYGIWLKQLMEDKGIKGEDFTGAVISCVVPEAIESLFILCKNLFNVKPIIVGKSDVNLGIKFLVDCPDLVGADRLANVVGTSGCYKGPQIIIDFGTATTFDVIDVDGNFHGGVIVPGINLSLEALCRRASMLSGVEVGPTKTIIGKDTKSAMQAGLYWGYVGMIEGLVTRIQGEFGEAMGVVATGGLASLFSDGTDVIKYIDPELTIRGLRIIYERNH